MKQNNPYLIKALNNYPWNLEEAVESLNYALSYEPNDPQALCLQGRIEVDVYQNYEAAIGYYQEALEEDIHATFLYPHYLYALIWNEDYEQAEKLADFALTVKSVDKAVIYARKALIKECKTEYKKALKLMKEAKRHTYNDGFIYHLDEMKKRIKSKVPKAKKEGKNKTKKKKKTKCAK
jgi:tetratricopeptide (TPR) repeat protein